MTAKKKTQNKPSGKRMQSRTLPLQNRGKEFSSRYGWLIALGALLLYFRIFRFDFVSWDDDQYIFKNPYILSLSWSSIVDMFSSFHFANYHPLTTLTYAIDYQLWGFNPGGWHLENAVLHALNTYLVFYFFRLLTRKQNVAIIVSLLFAVHPMHVESVAWVSERKDVLYTFFFLLSLIFYLRFLRDKQGKYFLISLLLFTASLLSKSAAVTLAPVLLLLDYFEERKFTRMVILEKAIFFALSILFGILAIKSQQTTESISDLSLTFSFAERIFLITYTLGFYFFKLLIPVNLSAMYYYPDTANGSLPLLYYLSLPALGILGYLLYRLKMVQREIVFGILFFLFTASVILQIIPVGFAIAADRYTYVPYLGLFFILASVADKFLRNQKYRMLTIGILSVLIVTFTAGTYMRTSQWKNGYALFTDVIEKNPEHFHGYWIRGNMKANVEDWKGSLADYDMALKFKPDFAFGLTNRGDVKLKLNENQSALQDLNLALMLNPSLPEAYNNRGMAHDALGNRELALKDYNMAIKLKPTMEKAYNNRGVLRAQSGDTKGAMEDLNRAVELNPQYAEAYSNRGNLKGIMKDYAGSIREYDQALSIRPDDAAVYFNRGISKMTLKDMAGACADWSRAAELGHAQAAAMKEQYCK